jgi:hypothetical protein
VDRPLREASRADPVAHLRARLRVGEASEAALELAARLGHAPAARALGQAPEPPQRARDLAPLLEDLGREATVRAVLACSEALGLAEAREPYARSVAVKILSQIRAWLEEPSPRHLRALADLDADFLSWFEEGYWLAALLDCVTEPGYAARLEHVLETADQNLGEREACRALERLVPWLLTVPG